MLDLMCEYRLLEEVRREQLRRAGDDVARGEALTNLGWLLQTQGRLDDAEPLYRESLEIRRKALGPEHPDVGASLNNLAVLLFNTGRLQEAEPVLCECIEIQRKALGEEHPDFQDSMRGLQMIRRKLNDGD